MAAQGSGLIRLSWIFTGGPHSRTDKINDPFYGSRAIERSFKALNPGGHPCRMGEKIFDEEFIKRLSRAGFSAVFKRVGKGGYCHAVFSCPQNYDQALIFSYPIL